ncbi:MAG: flagellar basal body-associated FliL family protein [Clostridia bacterium]|nr:flagellar basal body-associated FliL family protein [Clostridia bacterium]
MEGKGSFFILLFIVAFLSLTLAVLAGYVFFVAGTPKNNVEASSKHEAEKKVSKEELKSLQLFDGKKYLNLKSTDDKKLSVIQIGITVNYLKGKDEKKSEEHLKLYMDELKEAVIAYFSSMTIEEAKNQTEAMAKAKEALLKKFNEIVPPDEKDKEKKPMIESVVFYDWFTQ